MFSLIGDVFLNVITGIFCILVTNVEHNRVSNRRILGEREAQRLRAALEAIVSS